MDEQGFVKLMSGERHGFPGKKGAIFARQTADSQKRTYSRLVAAAARVEGGGKSTTRKSAQLLLSLIETEVFTNMIKIKEESGVFYIVSPLPILDENAVDQWLTGYFTNPDDKSFEGSARDSAFMVAGIVAEGFERSWPDASIWGSLESDVITALLRYSQVKYWRQQIEHAEGPLASTFDNLRARSEATAATIEREREQYRADSADRTAQLKVALDAATEVNISLEALTNKMKEQEIAAQDRLKNLEKSIRAEMELNTMRVLWKDRALQAERALQWSFVVVTVMGAAAFIFVLFAGHQVLEFVAPFSLRTIILNSSVAGAISQQLGRIILVSIPAVMYFWLVKIVVRMLIRSLLLMDDARQRQTIMESYFLLTKEGKTDDRALPMMLWALFRQVPGHGADGIEPPDFTEAINAGLKTSVLGKAGS